MTVTIVVVILALVVGLLANRFLRSRMMDEDAGGITAQDLISPMETLAVLLLAFVLVVAAESYATAQAAAGTEAGAVDYLFEVAAYAPAAQGQRIQADAVCYARAVSALEWPAVAEGGSSSAPGVWSSDLRAALKDLGSADQSFELLVEADKERGDGRRVRLTEADPAIPGIVYWFMLLTLAVTVAAFAFSLPRRKNGVEIITLMILAVLFTLSLLLIRDVDRPFGGVIAVDASAMQRTERDLTEDFLAEYGQVPLPCDAQGRPTS